MSKLTAHTSSHSPLGFGLAGEGRGSRARFALRRPGLLRSWRFLLVAAVSALLLVGSSAMAEEEDRPVILINARNPTNKLSAEQIKNLFMGSTGFWHGVVPVRVVVRASNTKAGEIFYEQVLGQSYQAFSKHWDKLQLSGRAVAPKVVTSAEELAKAIASTPGAVGFAMQSEAWKVSGVKVIELD